MNIDSTIRNTGELIKCPWCKGDEKMEQYHDLEWGVPVYDDKLLFEFLILEGAQAGLSWRTVLNKREGYRNAFSNFNVEKVANFNEKDVNRLIADSNIIRNKLKINAAINNSKRFIEVQKEFGSFSNYIWGFLPNNKPIINKFENLNELPACTVLSDKISKDLKRRGFKFVGSTIIYSHMQATGMVNDHLVTCFRHKEVNK